VGVPTNPRCLNQISPQRHLILILINAADDSRRIFSKRVHGGHDAHTPHYSAAIPKKDSSHVVGADIRLHLRRLRSLAAMRFATRRRLYPQSCPDRSRRNTGQAFAPACLLSGGRSVASTVQKFSITSAMPRGASSVRRKAARPSRIAVRDVVANTRAIARPSSPTLSSGTSRLTRPRQSPRQSLADVLFAAHSRPCTAANDVRVGPLYSIASIAGPGRSAGLAPLRILSWDMESDPIPR
jgi:hypothetical protein